MRWECGGGRVEVEGEVGGWRWRVRWVGGGV